MPSNDLTLAHFLQYHLFADDAQEAWLWTVRLIPVQHHSHRSRSVDRILARVTGQEIFRRDSYTSLLQIRHKPKGSRAQGALRDDSMRSPAMTSTHPAPGSASISSALTSIGLNLSTTIHKQACENMLNNKKRLTRLTEIDCDSKKNSLQWGAVRFG
jgi:hypothetical protein